MVGPLHGVLERPLPFPSSVQSYSTLLPGLTGGQLVCGWRRTWELHPSEDRSELHRRFEYIAMQKYHYLNMDAYGAALLWRDKGGFSDYGYICRPDGQPLQLPQQGMDMTMQ